MHPRTASSWQIILADLALILFLVTAAALAASAGSSPKSADAARQEPLALKPASHSQPQITPDIASDLAPLAPAQALYRNSNGGVDLAQWLEQQPRDPRASLTIVAQYSAGEEDRLWAKARAMASVATQLDVRSRVIIRPGPTSDIYASLAYDLPLE